MHMRRGPTVDLYDLLVGKKWPLLKISEKQKQMKQVRVK